MNNEHYVRSFLAHRRALQQFYAELPADQAHFKAWEGGMDFLAQANHLASSAQRLVGMLQNREVTPGEAATDLAGVRQRLESTNAEVVTAISSLQEADLAKVVPAFGSMQMPIAALVDMLIGHEAHHKGQVWLMARMIGIAPPRYVQLG